MADSMMMTKPQLPGTSPDFVTHLHGLALTRADDKALTVACSQGGQTVDTTISYGQLDWQVRALAARLQQDFGPGERALIMLDNDEHHVISFFACLYAGLIAVPVFPPESIRPQHLERLSGIAADSRACCILTSSAVQSMIASAGEAFPQVRVIAVDKVGEEGAGPWRHRTPAPGDIAFLQYTSGSTSAPKGVMVTHASLMANMRAIEEGLSVGAADVFVSWLPLNHDMGLIGGLLQPIHRGIPVVLMSPRFFLERPVRWLEAISRHRGTISGGPDFAYRLCLERVTEAQWRQLDLSSWQVAFSGAEPVRAETLRLFGERGALAGFSAEAVYPCYGLAESTLFVTGGRRGAGLVSQRFSASHLAQGQALPVAEGGATLVGCGHAPSAHQVEIVDPGSMDVLAPGRIGEIWASGPSLGQGYWGKLPESLATFVERGGRRWLRTGDLGFVHGGQLYVAGRIKDMVIVRGHNLYPQDLERAVEREVGAVRQGRVAVFAVDGPQGEGIGLAAEVSRGMQKVAEPAALVEALSAAVSEQCGEPLSVVMLLQPGGMPKTTSGKLQRGACRKAWLEGTANAYALYQHGSFVLGGPSPQPQAEAALDEVEAALALIWLEVLGQSAEARPLSRKTHFFTQGGNSLTATQAALKMSMAWNTEVPPRWLFEQPRLGECAARLRQVLAEGAVPRQAVSAMPPTRLGLEGHPPAPLSHAQRRQWFLWRLNPGDTAYHVAAALHLGGALCPDALRQALVGLVQRHESLRTVIGLGADELGEQRVLSTLDLPMAVTDLSKAPWPSRALLADEAAQAFNARPFDLTQGPLFRVALLKLDDDQHRLLMAMHHIVSDATSMQMLVDDLAALYQAAQQSEPAVLPALATRYADYANWHGAWLAQGAGERQLAYWRGQLGTDHPSLTLPTDHPRAALARYQAAHHVIDLPQDVLAALRESAHVQGATLFMSLLAGFQALMHRHTGLDDVRVGVPVANRQHAGIESVTGFFVNTLVMRHVIDDKMSLAALLAGTRQAALDAQAHQDLPFEQLVEALQPERSASHAPLFQVVFNHLSRDLRRFERLTGLTAAVEVIPGQAAQFELTLETVEQSDGRVSARFTFARELFEPETIGRLGEHYVLMLRALAQSPALAVGEVELAVDAECTQLRRWGDQSMCMLSSEPIHGLIERQARRQPQATAVVHEGESLSYAQLDEQANRLAHRLLKMGVGPESRVGVALERSTTMIVAILGILKAGGAYVPLDPDYPAERLAYMLADSGIELLLTTSGLKARVLPFSEDTGAIEALELDTL
ncbi:MAG: AMP-binding protein, partial [Aquabacterium sp.]|uniref:AMP-binding protein n=1 Tax=Aquabacterium sp. TaxID=1872578 RepID=UPI002723179E